MKRLCALPAKCRAGAQTGSGLIEVMVLAFIMAVGMLALGRMHVLLVREGATSNNHSIAVSLAQEKIDDLRTFKWVDHQQAANNGENCAADNVPCFISIGNNQGGARSSGGLVFPAGEIVVGNTTFNRTWHVTDGFYCGSTTLFTTCSDSLSSPTPAVKYVTVTVSWTDQNDANPITPAHDAHVVRIRTTIAKDDALLAAFNADRLVSSSTGGYGPRVSYAPGAVPDVVPVPIIQNDIKKETTKPLPDVVSVGNSVATTFETATYRTVGGTTKQILDDFVTVSCVCQFTSDGEGYPASYYYWDADSNPQGIRVKYPTSMVSKKRGVPAISNQHALCGSCCRDHHDSSVASTALYDPHRPAGDYTASGNHKHYWYANAVNASGNTTGTTPDPTSGLAAVNETPGNKYLEACRFMRVDGSYRLMQDWRAIDLIVMPKDRYLANPSTLATYQGYVRNFLRYAARADCIAAGVAASTCGMITQASPPDKSTLVNRNLSNQSGSTQLLSRALYLDRVYGKNTPRTLDGAYYTALAGRIAAYQTNADEVWLDIVPFNEINTTLLTSWYSSNPASVVVTNEAIVDVGASVEDYYGVYCRGQVTVNASGSADVWAVLLPSNSGLTGGAKQGSYSSLPNYDSNTLSQSGTIAYPSQIGIDRHDHSTAMRKTDFINISTSSSPTVFGEIRLGNARAGDYWSGLAVTTSGGVSCSISGEGNARAYSCPVHSGFTGTLGIRASSANAFFDHGTDGVYDTEGANGFTATVSVSNVTHPVNAGVFWMFSPFAEVRGSINCADVCNDVEVKTNTGTPCDVNRTAGTVSCAVELDPVSKGWSGSVSITNKPGYNRYLAAVLGGGSCSPTATTSDDSVSLSAGPADRPSALTVCASSGTALNTCTLDGVTVNSGESLWAYSARTVAYPTQCSEIQEQRFCMNGVLSGSFPYSSCNRVCTVPSIDGDPITSIAEFNAVNNKIKSAGYTASHAFNGSLVQANRVANQSPSPGATPSCGSSVSYQFNFVPTPSWTGTQNPKALSWSTVPGATQYEVYSCNGAGCTPSVLTSTQAGTSYTPSVRSGETKCYNVRASNGATRTGPSSTYCVSRQGQNYAYTP